jgi:hypothetical protein
VSDVYVYFFGSCCDVVYPSCEAGHPSSEFTTSTELFQPLPHKPFFKRHLLKGNCERTLGRSRAHCQVPEEEGGGRRKLC